MHRQAELVAPPCPEEGAISWNINTSCNFRCAYCTQRFKEDRARWSRDTPAFLEAFSRLPGRWEVKLSGGEPFVHPTLAEIVSGLARLGHRVSVVTNFSASRDTLTQFLDQARGQVGVFSCSLHLAYVPDLQEFIQKAQWMQALLLESTRPPLPSPSLCVTTVATKAALPALKDLANRFRDAGLTFKIQPEKQARDLVPYTDSERELLLSLGGHNLSGRIEHSFEGLACWAGARYFILDDLGEAYRCYAARRYRIERMGNFLRPDFALADCANQCLYSACNCTVPISRRMMLHQSLEDVT